MKAKTIGAAVLVAASLAACTTTNTVPISPDTFRLDSIASGYGMTESAGADTLLKAAKITQERGYPYFRILDSNSGASTEYAGASFNNFGGAWFTTANHRPTQNVSYVVKMLTQNEPGAWNAAEVVALKGKVY